MADEAEEGGGGDEGGTEDGGSVLKKYGPFAAIILVVQVILSWVVIQYFWVDGGAEEEEATFSPPETQSVTVTSDGEEDDGVLPFYYTDDILANITANPAGTNSERFAVISAQLGLKCLDEEGTDYLATLPPAEFIKDNPVFDALEQNKRRILSVITKKIRRKTIDELSGENIEYVEEEMQVDLQKQVFDRIKDKEWMVEHCKPRVVEVDITSVIIQ